MSVTSESSPAVAADFVLRGASELVTMSAPPAEGLGAIAGGALAPHPDDHAVLGREGLGRRCAHRDQFARAAQHKVRRDGRA